MRTVIETPTFQKQADAVWSAGEREAFIDFIACDPDAGVLGFGGIAAGASEIARVLFYVFLVVFLVTLVMGAMRR